MSFGQGGPDLPEKMKSPFRHQALHKCGASRGLAGSSSSPLRGGVGSSLGFSLLQDLDYQ